MDSGSSGPIHTGDVFFCSHKAGQKRLFVS